jgi:hypothetical protein
MSIIVAGLSDTAIPESAQYERVGQMQETIEPPTLREFIEAVREAFAFLRNFGFDEVPPPPHRAAERFQVWFSADHRSVIIKGEGYGTMASVMLEYEDRLELPESDLVPANERPLRKRSSKKKQAGQLQQIRDAARRVEKYGHDFLAGDVSEFLRRARPLPPYKRVH